MSEHSLDLKIEINFFWRFSQNSLVKQNCHFEKIKKKVITMTLSYNVILVLKKYILHNINNNNWDHFWT